MRILYIDIPFLSDGRSMAEDVRSGNHGGRDYLERLEATGRSDAAAILRERHPGDNTSTGLFGIPKDVLESLGVDD